MAKQYSVRNITPVPLAAAPFAVVDFPPNPQIGDTFTAPTGSVYMWDGTVWIGAPSDIGVASNVPIGANPPVGSVPGQLWWRNDPDCTLFILYNDGTSTQWVPAVRPNSVTGIPDAPSDGNTYGRLNGAWVILP